MEKLIIDSIDILTRGTNKWLQVGGKHTLAAHIFIAWSIYQLFLHLWLLKKFIKWVGDKLK